MAAIIIPPTMFGSVLAASLATVAAAAFTPAILAAPVIGQPLYYVTPGYSGTVTGQQWYRNKGAGPVLIPGATGSAYTPTKTSTLGDSDVGGFFSVEVRTPSGNVRSQEFSALGQVLVAPVFLTSGAPRLGTNYLTTVATTITFGTAVTVRMMANYGSPTTYYETTVAPGTYVGGSSTVFGTPSLVGGDQFSTAIYAYKSISSPACIDAMVDSTPATATRPTASTGVGFFTKNGELYDANGNKTRLRGFNRCHFNTNPSGFDSGLFNAGANIQRIFLYTSRDFATIQKPLLDRMVANSVIPCPTFAYTGANFTGTIAGNVLTAGAVTGVIAPSANYSQSGGAFDAAGVPNTVVIKQQLTNTNADGIPGREGTYSLSGSYTVSTPTAMSYTNSCTGLPEPEIIIANAQILADQAANYAYLERYSILNLGNEWGPAVVSNIANGGTGYVDGLYTNVPLTGGAGTGMAATIRVTSGVVTSLHVTAYGSGYVTGNALSAANTSLGGTGSGLSYLLAGGISSGGSGFTAGTYTGVPLRGGSGTGKLATIVVASGSVNSVTETTTGSGYLNGDILRVDAADVGGTGVAFNYRVGAGNTVWRDTMIKCVQMMRAAGHKGTLMIDAPGSGQNTNALLTMAETILLNDPQKNLIFSLHIYGNYRAGTFAADAVKLRTLATTLGITFVIGEFGPANMNSGAGSITTTPTLESMSVAEACHLGWLFWAWDDPPVATGADYSSIAYAACKNAAANYFSTSDPAQLTVAGRQLVLDPVNGLKAKAQPASIF